MPRAGAHVMSAAASPRTFSPTSISVGMRPVFARLLFFRYENDHFTKTGSGQTIGKVEKRSCSAGVLPFLYDGLFRNGTGPNVLEHMFPIEVLRIEPGEKKRLGGGLPFFSKLPFCLSRACLDKSPGFIDLPGTHKLTTSACLVFC